MGRARVLREYHFYTVRLGNCVLPGASLQYVRLWGNRFGRASSETMAEVLEQLAEEGRDMDIDVKPYCVDGAWMVAEL